MIPNAKKIAAFTLTEMLVVLAISVIIVGMAFAVITLFTRNLQLIQNNLSESTKINLMEQQLTVDFNRYHQIKYTRTLNQLNLKTPLDSIVYTFNEDMILREEDTLLNSPYQKHFYLRGDEIEKGILDAIKIELQKNANSVFVFKTNNASKNLTLHGN